MTPSELTTRVTLDTCAAVAALAALVWWLAGESAGLGVLVGCALAVVNFRWLVACAFVATSTGKSLAIFGALGILLAQGGPDEAFIGGRAKYWAFQKVVRPPVPAMRT